MADEAQQKSWQELMDEYQAAKNLPVAQMSEAPAPDNNISLIPQQQDVQDTQGLLQMLRQQAGIPANPEIGAPTPQKELASEPSEDDSEEVAQKRVPKAKQEEPVSKPSIPEEQVQSAEKVDYSQALKDAQEQQRQNLNNARIDRGGAQMLAAAGRTTPDYTQAEAEEKQAGLPIQNLQQQIGISDIQNKLNSQQEMMDPNSPTSKMLRDFAKRYGFNLADNVSGAHIEKIAPYMVKAFEAEENRKARIQVAQENREARRDVAGMRADQMGEKKSAAQEKDTTNRFDKLDKLLTAEVTSGRTSLGQDAQGLRAIENAQALLNSTKDLNSLDNRQVYEAARVLDRVLSGGVGGQTSSAHLTPETAKSYMQGLIEKATNQRQGADLGSFMSSMNDTFAREKAVAEERVKKTQHKLLGSSKDLMEKDPIKWQTLMTAHGLPQDPFSPTADPKMQQKIQLYKQLHPDKSNMKDEDVMKEINRIQGK